VGILRKLDLSAFGEVDEGGSYTFPINIIKRGSLPIGCKKGVVLFRFLDKLLVESGSSGSHGDIVILFLGYQSAIMEKGC
jgi:hypothetical protein